MSLLLLFMLLVNALGTCTRRIDSYYGQSWERASRTVLGSGISLSHGGGTARSCVLYMLFLLLADFKSVTSWRSGVESAFFDKTEEANVRHQL
jgi:hypothetical protein